MLPSRTFPGSLSVLAVLGVLGASSASGQFTLTYQFDVGAAVPDGGELLSAKTVSGSLNSLTSLEVLLGISPKTAGGGFLGDLYVALGHGDDLTVLLNRPGKLTEGGLGYSDGSGLSVTFSDSAPNGDIHVYRETLNGDHNTPLGGPLEGTWMPDGRFVDPDTVVLESSRSAVLSAIDLATAIGEYRLLTVDNSLGAEHILDSWGLRFYVDDNVGSTLSISDTLVSGYGSGLLTIKNSFVLQGGVTFGGSQALTLAGAVQLDRSQSVRFDVATTFQNGIGETGGSFGFTKTGTGALVLSGAGTYSGGTEIAEGQVVVNNTSGSATGTGSVLVRDGASLSGGGTIAGPATFESGSTYSSGIGVGMGTFGEVVMKGGSEWLVQMNDAEGGAGADPGWDRMMLNAGLTFDASSADRITLRLQSLGLDGMPGFALHFDDSQNYEWIIATATDGVFGFDPSYFTIDFSGFSGANQGQFALKQEGLDVVLIHVVPEPSPAGLAIAGAGLLWLVRRRGSQTERV